MEQSLRYRYEMAQGLTKKEKGFVKDYIELGNGTEAALNNYDTDSESVAAVIASENIRKPKIQQAIAEMLPDDLLAEKHLALLNKIDDKGEIDVQAVSKGLDMGYKIKGTYAPEKSVTANITVNTVDPKAIEIAKKYEEELKQGL